MPVGKRLTPEQKQKVIDHAKEKGPEAAAKKFGLHPVTVKRYVSRSEPSGEKKRTGKAGTKTQKDQKKVKKGPRPDLDFQLEILIYHTKHLVKGLQTLQKELED